MPDSPSPFDDPFADLFGKLPDPRAQRARAAGKDGGPGPSRPDPTAPAPPPAAPVPRSRREARAAATGAAAAGPSFAPSSAQPAPASGQPQVPASGQQQAPASVPQSAPRPAAAPSSREPGVVPVAAGRAPGSPVGRDPRRRTPDLHAGASAGLEDLFAGERTTDDLGAPPPPPNRRRRRIGGWVALGVVVVILGGIAAGGFAIWNTYESQIRAFMGWEEPKDYAAGEATGEAFVTISSGDTGSPISQALFDAGVTKTPTAFYDHLIDTGQNPPFVPGVFRLQQRMTSEAALAALLDPANKMENGAALPEGLSVAQSLERLAEGTGIPLSDFQAAVADPSQYGITVDPAIVAAGGQPLEGWLFPATYEFEPDTTATQIIQRLVDRTIQSLDEAQVPVEDRQRILTLASIIQREARFEADMKKVSRVIENRLDPSNDQTFGLLQMDSTAQYGYGQLHSGSASSSAEALADPNPWNTYQNTGLPIGPISNPGDVAIDAAMHPADGDWLYFVTVNLDTGETVFTNNVDDHNAAVAQWQSWCSEHPDSGC